MDNTPHDNDQINGDRQATPAAKTSSIKPVIATFVILGAVVISIIALLGNKKAAEPLLQSEEQFSTGVTTQARVEPIVLDPQIVEKEDTQPKIDPMLAQRQALLIKQATELAERERLAKAKLAEQRNKAPLFAFNSISSSNAPVADNTNLGNPMEVDDANLAYMKKAVRKQVKTTDAVQIDEISSLVPQGTLISAVLETAIQSDLPGMVRAVVNRPVWSFDVSQILIPAGSQLIGTYRSVIERGQTRVFIVWDRVLRPDGVSVQLASPSTDVLGRTGLSGERDTKFLERFGSSILLSLIDGSIEAGVRAIDDEQAATVAVNSGRDANRAAEIALKNSIDIPPTIHVNQGTPINVFVSQDLNFAEVSAWMP